MSPTLLESFRASLRAASDRPALVYLDTVLSRRELDDTSDALAVALAERGFGAGDRLALYMQNMPQYVVGLLAAWKVGGIAVPVNPMLTPGEVAKLVADAKPSVLLALDELCTHRLVDVLNGSSVSRILTTSALEWQNSGDMRVLPSAQRRVLEFGEDLIEVMHRFVGRRPPEVTLTGDDVAVITYTSGTTGKPKGAMNTHRNVANGGDAYRRWFDLDEDDAILGIAPLFHVTGLSGHIAAALTAGAPLVLCYRFQPDVVVDVIRRHRPTFTVGALTVFIALGESGATRDDLASLTKIASGGAPVAVGVLETFEEKFGTYIYNVDGMTETTSPVSAVPVGRRAPVDADTCALSVGRPMLSAEVTILDDDKREAAVGSVGELAVAGPQIVPGYWNQPERTAGAHHGRWLLTGDVGYVDRDGWYYLVDRKRDMIVASGYKVWPREVEDVLYGHEAVLEAAVIGQPDPCRGETVKAFVSVRAGLAVSADELIRFCRDRLAAYKIPRDVQFVESIPKTATGKVLRRELRGRVPT